MYTFFHKNPYRLLKSILDIFAFIIVPLALIIVSIALPTRETFVFFGKAATLLLLFILFLKPLSVIDGSMFLRRLLAYRRQLGVAIFWFALFHSIMFIYDRELYAMADYMGWDNYLSYGLWAMLGMGILAATSNNYSVKTLRKNWQRVQYLAYPVLFLVLIHASMAEGEIQKVFIIGGAYGVLKVLEKRKAHFSVINRLIQTVSQKRRF